MWVNEQLKEKWFGDDEAAKKMQLEFKIRKFICGIKTFSINSCGFV
jgi:hypothetical protein